MVQSIFTNASVGLGRISIFMFFDFLETLSIVCQSYPDRIKELQQTLSRFIATRHCSMISLLRHSSVPNRLSMIFIHEIVLTSRLLTFQLIFITRFKRSYSFSPILNSKPLNSSLKDLISLILRKVIVYLFFM